MARIEDLGFGWISVWDHFYGATGRPDDAACLEAVAMHAALACSTSKVRCGSLVYSIGYRHPAVLAKAITAIDQLSGGRADMGIGAGWALVEYQAYGIPFPDVKTRMDQLEEGIQCLRGLLHDDVTTFEGKHFTLTEARNEPRPLQDEAADLDRRWGREADAQHRREVRRRMERAVHRARHLRPQERRARSALRDGRPRPEPRSARAINVGLAFTEESLQTQFGAISDFVRPGVLSGSDEQIIDTIGRYVEAGADQVNLALRAPFDLDSLERFSAMLQLV